MALVPIAKLGNFIHIYDFKVDPDHIDDFIRLFNEFDYSDENPMHKSAAQVKDGALGGVRTLCGLVYAADGEPLVFAILANNFAVPGPTITAAIDALVVQLASFRR